MEDYVYFQYHADSPYGVFLRYRPSQFSQDLAGALKTAAFRSLEEKDIHHVEETLKKDIHARLLTLSLAGLMASLKIQKVRESDRFGPESVMQERGHTVYRFKEVAMIVFSKRSQEWQLGCFETFGDKHCWPSCLAVLHRYISWVLAPLGVVGFWGTPMDEGPLLLRREEAKGEGLFVDLHRERLLSGEEAALLPRPFKIFRTGALASGMSKEELLGFLSHRTSYLGLTGLPKTLRQTLVAISHLGQGHTLPKTSLDKASGPPL